VSPLSAAPSRIERMSDTTASTQAEQPELLHVTADGTEVVQGSNDLDDVTTTTEGPLDRATATDDTADAHVATGEASSAGADVTTEGPVDDATATDGTADADLATDEASAAPERDDAGGDQEVLGASEPGEASTTVKDPSDWVTGDEPMTGAQKSYLDTLARAAGDQLSADLTKAEASEHIERLQAKTGRGSS
jgi:hypothetical protein